MRFTRRVAEPGPLPLGIREQLEAERDIVGRERPKLGRLGARACVRKPLEVLEDVGRAVGGPSRVAVAERQPADGQQRPIAPVAGVACQRLLGDAPGRLASVA